MKPLILVNGKPLVRHAVDHAYLWGAAQHVIVVSPDNARLVTQVVDRNYFDWVLQPEPTGVVDALRRAVRLVTGNRALILCADNTFQFENPDELACELKTRAAAGESLIATRELSVREAARFTTLEFKEPGARCGLDVWPAGRNHKASQWCWIGPLLLQTTELRASLQRLPAGSDSVVEVILGATRGGLDLQPLPMLCEDLGIPEELT